MNNIFEWTKEMSVDNPILDKQHKEIIDRLNNLVDKLSNKVEREDIENVLVFMNNYIVEHKACEEQYMKDNNYPDLDWHIKEHEFFEKQYEVFKKSFKEGANPSILAMEMERYLGGWLFHHIMNTDKRYAEFIRNKNKKQ